MNDDIKKIYKDFETYDIKKILKYSKIPVIYQNLGNVTLGYTTTIKRIKMIVISDALSDVLTDFILGHEYNHVINNDIGTPYYRRVGAFAPISKKETRANNFSLALLAYRYELEQLSKYKQVEKLGLNDYIDY